MQFFFRTLQRAVINKDVTPAGVKEVVDAIIRKMDDTNADTIKTEFGRALAVALNLKNMEKVQVLVKTPFNMSKSDLVAKAVGMEDIELVSILIAKIKNPSYDEFVKAVALGNLAIFELLLKKYKISDLNEFAINYNLLHIAMENKQYEMAGHLLYLGYSGWALDDALVKAVIVGEKSLVELLVIAGADPNADNGAAFTMALEYNQAEIFTHLLYHFDAEKLGTVFLERFITFKKQAALEKVMEVEECMIKARNLIKEYTKKGFNDAAEFLLCAGYTPDLGDITCAIESMNKKLVNTFIIDADSKLIDAAYDTIISKVLETFEDVDNILEVIIDKAYLSLP